MSTTDFGNPDVIVIGAGNAACCAALAARESGAKVIVLEAAPIDDCGGNSRYTAGAVRIVFNGADDLAQLYDITDDERKTCDYGTYTEDQYFDDMGRITNYRTGSGPVRNTRQAQFRNDGVDAQKGREVPSTVRPPGIQG